LHPDAKHPVCFARIIKEMNKKRSTSHNQKKDPETWVDHYGDYLYRYALPRVQDSSVAEDLVQETFLAALQSHKNFQSRSSEKTWLTGILKHKVADFYRQKAKIPPGSELDVDSVNTDAFFDGKGQWKLKPPDWTADPEKLYGQKEFIGILNLCLSELSSRLAQVFVLREIDGLKTDEICKVLNITATNCWVMLYRARMYLRRCLEINWFTRKASKES
jgi:RNA polymerase sigma-70 factor (TIGR02943 family)